MNEGPKRSRREMSADDLGVSAASDSALPIEKPYIQDADDAVVMFGDPPLVLKWEEVVTIAAELEGVKIVRIVDRLVTLSCPRCDQEWGVDVPKGGDGASICALFQCPTCPAQDED